MDEEDAFLRKLLEQPASDLTRLVYADWLDERGTPEATVKAEFLRLIADSELAGRFPDRVQVLARKLDSRWLATVSKLPVENCEYAELEGTGRPSVRRLFDFLCPKRWDAMTPTERVGERFCPECRQTVHYCNTPAEVRQHAQQGNCIAVGVTVQRRYGDTSSSPDLEEISVGLPMGEDELGLVDLERDKQTGENEDLSAQQRKRRRR